jgi:hypothetical protein
VLAGGGQGGFDSVVNTIELRYHTHATRIPFLGLISFFSGKAMRYGADNLHVAEFEDFPGNVDGSELSQIIEEKLGSGWEPVVRETSRHGGEQTLVFMRPEGERMGLFVVDKDRDELDIVQVSVDPKHLDDNIGHYSHRRDTADRDVTD